MQLVGKSVRLNQSTATLSYQSIAFPIFSGFPYPTPIDEV